MKPLCAGAGLRGPQTWKLAGLLALALAGATAFAPVSSNAQDTDEEAGSKADAGFALLKEILVRGNTITVKTTQPAPYNVFKVSSPDRLVLELSNTENDWKKKDVAIRNSDFFSRVRSAQFQNEPVKIARVVIELKGPVEYEAKAEGNLIRLSARKPGADAAAPPAEPDPQSMAAAPTPAEVQNQVSPEKPAAPPAETAEPDVPAAPVPLPARKAESRKEPYLATTDPSSLFGRQPVTLDFYDIDLKELFRMLGEKAGVNVVFSNGVKGSVSIQLKDVSFKDAVDTILALNDLKLIAMGKNIVQLLTPGEFDKYRVSAISMTKIFPINYAKALDVNAQLGTILATLGGKGKTIVDDRTNSIIVTDTPEGIETTGRLIQDLDKPAPQVMIEAKIVQVSLGKSIDLGITWGVAYTDQRGNQMVTIGAAADNSEAEPAPGSGGVGLQTRTPLNPSGGSGLELGGSGFSAGQGLGLTFGFVKDVVRLNAALSALQQKNKSKLLSNPKIATLNNQPASIRSEVSEPYLTTQTQLTNAGTLSTQIVNQAKSGISLTVTPTINADGRITMKIAPDITSSQPTAIGVPKTTSQQADTTVIVQDGETFVIGGLISELESDQKSYVPVLGSIPLLGHLFKKTGVSKSRAELLVFVTPKIIPY